jgi:hypothetical protein
MSPEHPDELVPRRQVAKEFGVDPRTIVRWKEHSAFTPVKINGRNYYHRALVESAKKLGFGPQRNA